MEQAVAIQQPTKVTGLGWAFLIVFVYVFSSIFYAIGFSVLGPEDVSFSQYVNTPSGLAYAVFIQFLVTLPVILLAASRTQSGWVKALGFERFSKKHLREAIIIFTALYGFSHLVSYVFDIKPDDFLTSIANSQNILLFLAISLCAPILEELFFRGYLFNRLRNTKLGFTGTALTTSLLFTLAHVNQYSLPQLSMIMILALVLFYLRERSGSIWLPMQVHFLQNAITSFAIIYLGFV